ncbi:MAG: hypothetical protein V4598_04045 [Bdellovibrionota bacterium]
MNRLIPELVCELPVSAASGLVICGDKFFIISDDELSLLSGDFSGNYVFTSLWEHELPDDPKLRKKLKPDLESLYLDGPTLWALPSFSRPNRVKGARIELSSDFKILQHEEVDFTDLYQKLSMFVPDLNIEGAVLKDNILHLFQRGNGKQGSNSIITIHKEEVHIRPLKLPHFNGIPLTVTDATMLDGEIFYLAVAEDTDSTYLDGKVKGAFLGRLHGVDIGQIEFQGKPEGLSFHSDGYLYFVTDDDSRKISSRLFRLKI